LSAAVALPVTDGSVEVPQLTVTSLGSVITGAVLSTIVSVCADVLKLPAASVAFQVLVIVLPDVISLYVIAIAPLQLSVAVAFTVGAVEPPQLTVAAAGAVMVGLVTSLITTVWFWVLVLPLPSL
jgi:hypothetical protein